MFFTNLTKSRKCQFSLVLQPESKRGGLEVRAMLPCEQVRTTSRWRHNDHDSVSNHQPHGGLLNRYSDADQRKTSKLRVTGLCVGNSPGPVNSPHKGPVTRKMFPFDDVIMKVQAFRVCESFITMSIFNFVFIVTTVVSAFRSVMDYLNNATL